MSVKKVIQGILGSGATQTYVDDVFSTYLYTGNGSTQTITNGINLLTTSAWDLTTFAQYSAPYNVNPDIINVFFDSSDNMYVTTRGTFANAGGTGLGLWKFNPSGTTVWKKILYEMGIANTYSSVIDSSNNTYVLGSEYSMTSNQYYALLVKYNESGTLQWRKQIIQTSTYPVKLLLDSNQNLIVVTTNQIGTNTANYKSIIKFNPSGTEIWNKSFRNSTLLNSGLNGNVTIDSSDNIYMSYSTYNY